MICHRCLQRLARRDVVTSTSNAIVHLRPRPFSHSASPRSPPVAVETTSASSSTSNTTSPPETITSNKRTAPAVVSSVPEGTPLKGLSFLKTQPDPLARADHEYPEWLWRVLDEQRASGKPDGAEIEGDLFGTFYIPLVTFLFLFGPVQRIRNLLFLSFPSQIEETAP